MFHKRLFEAPEFEAGDLTLLREIAHPEKDQIPIGYSVAHARLLIGQASVAHRLSGTEMYYILQGYGTMHIDGEQFDVRPNETFLVPANSEQYIENTGIEELVFLCIVEPYWREEDEHIG